MANLDPNDVPFLLSEEAGGPINRELLRDKWTARTQLFFNNQNYGNRRGQRTSDGWTLPNLQLDPAVKYRAFDGQNWGDQILAGHVTGNWPSLHNAPKGVFFNPGVPLWSYAKPFGGSQQFVFATLGEGWGNRDANRPIGLNPSPLNWQEGGTGLTPEMQEGLKTFFPTYKFKTHEDVLGSELSLKTTNRLERTRKALEKFTALGNDVAESIKITKYNNVTLSERQNRLKNLEIAIKRIKKDNWIIEQAYDADIADLEVQIEDAKAKLWELRDRKGFDGMMERSDQRKKLDSLNEALIDAKVANYERQFEDFSREEAKALYGSEAVEGLKEHFKWLESAVGELEDARQGRNPNLAVSLKIAEGAITKNQNSFSSKGLSFLQEVVNQEEAFKTLIKNTFPSLLTEGASIKDYPGLFQKIVDKINAGEVSRFALDDFYATLAEVTRSFSPASLQPYLSYEVNPVPATYPMVGVDPSLLIHERDTPFSNYFLDEKNRPYLLGPGNKPVLLNASDDEFFLNQENILKNMTLFGGQGVTSDGRRMTLGRLDWAMMGKEGAMYSEQLPNAVIDSGVKTIVDAATGEKPRRIYNWRLPSDLPELNATGYELFDLGVRYENSLDHKFHKIVQTGYKGGENPYPEVGELVKLDRNDHGNAWGVKTPDGRIFVFQSDYSIEAKHYPLSDGLKKRIGELQSNNLKHNNTAPRWFELLDADPLPVKEVPLTFSVNAAAVNTEGTFRPSVLFRIDPNVPNGIEVVKEWNNEPTKWGFKPIPTGPLNPEALREAYVRFAQEVIDPVMSMTKDGVALDEFARLMKDVKHPEGSPEHTAAVESALKEANEYAEVEIGLNETRKLSAGLKGYTNAEDFASRALANGFPQDLFGLMYRTGRTTHDWTASTKTPGYERIQNIIDESTKGNPNYGKLGSNFGPQLERYFDDASFRARRDLKLSSERIKMAQSRYVNDAAFRSNVNSYVGERVPRVAMGALAGYQIKEHLDAGENIFQAVGNTAAEIATGIAKFNLYERYVGGINMMGDATIEGHKRRKQESEAIQDEWRASIARNYPEIGQDGKPVLPKVNWERVKEAETALERKKKEEATQKWIKENPLWVDGELNTGVL